MTSLQTLIRWELKRVMANICRAYAADNKPLPDELAVRLTVIEQMKSLKLAEVQPEDIRDDQGRKAG